METPFTRHNGQRQIALAFGPSLLESRLEFALFFPEEQRWDNNSHQNYRIKIGGAVGSPEGFLRSQFARGERTFEQAFPLLDGLQLAVGVTLSDSKYRVLLATNLAAPLWLHWGVGFRSPHEWSVAPESWRPPGTEACDATTVESPFSSRDGFRQLELVIPESEAPVGIQFVLKQGTENRWFKNQRGNFFIPIRKSLRGPAELQGVQLEQLVARIVQAEMGSGSWTLMHRFNLCYDLLGQAQDDPEALGLLFVWLRFSAVRQLTWQRNYNTKPRELTHAQDRLGDRLAELDRSKPQCRTLLRLMLATIGRGGDGQRIRDEILQIMHRHHVKEVSGHFLEEWHQKLHNNTTPDDVVICEAYLEFLRSNGNTIRFYQVLAAGGVSRERLENFERPIRSQPDFVGALKDALIHDFENFLKILNAVHSSTDLETAIRSASGRLDNDTQGLLWHVWNHRNDSGDGLSQLVEQITEARRRISNTLNLQDPARPALYLDLALEQQVRVAIERDLHRGMHLDQLMSLIGFVLENMTLSDNNTELNVVRRHWSRFFGSAPEPRSSREWALHAKAVLDSAGLALGDWTDRLYQNLQPKAEALGPQFNAEPWTIALFSEEVIRGSSLGFALSMLLHQAERALRQMAKLGVWQIISRGQGIGRVEVVDSLRSVQGKQFNEPVIVIADRVTGDEELPENLVVVLAPDVTDLVSHVAVRARNAQVLYAACSDPAVLNELRALKGRFAEAKVDSSGDVSCREVAAVPAAAVSSPKHLSTVRPVVEQWTTYFMAEDSFTDEVVGSKSCSQARLRGKLPAWAKQPVSIALPFGTFEHVLALGENREVAQQVDRLVQSSKKEINADALLAIRKTIQSLKAPKEFFQSLLAVFQRSQVPWPQDREAAWSCIKEVWASKWNERAVLSRRRMRLPDEALNMAVLIQPVIAADYAFVIHTVHPSTNDPDELYAEVVRGLGETLVGNFPGRAMGFAFNKNTGQLRLTSYPSKSAGLFGGGLIFRSDSNGEDLAGYAGAGLYDSVVWPAPRKELLEYADEPLVWDESFRSGLFQKIAHLGVAVERAFGSAQDIEGAICRREYFVVQSRPQVGLEKSTRESA